MNPVWQSPKRLAIYLFMCLTVYQSFIQASHKEMAIEPLKQINE